MCPLLSYLAVLLFYGLPTVRDLCDTAALLLHLFLSAAQAVNPPVDLRSVGGSVLEFPNAFDLRGQLTSVQYINSNFNIIRHLTHIIVLLHYRLLNHSCRWQPYVHILLNDRNR